jgi:hypothetical protein
MWAAIRPISRRGVDLTRFSIAEVAARKNKKRAAGTRHGDAFLNSYRGH